MWLDDNDNGDIGYSRVSSEEQGRTKSIENQNIRLRLEGCTRIYSDVESAYKGNDRPEFEELQSFIKSGAASGRRIVVCNSDRLSRRETVGFGFLELLNTAGLKLLIIDSPHIDVSTPDGWALLGYDIVNARAYSARLSKRVKQGHERHKARSAAYYALFGYVKNQETERLELDTTPRQIGNAMIAPAALAREAIELYLETGSLHRTCTTINSKYAIERISTGQKGNRQDRKVFRGWDYGTFLQWLINPILRGHTAYGRAQRQRLSHASSWEIAYNTHADHVLMTEEEYGRVVDLLGQKSHYGSRSFGEDKVKHIHVLSPVMRCGICNSSMGVGWSESRAKTWRKFYYGCRNHKYKSCRNGDVIGTGKTIRAEIVEAALVEALRAKASTIAELADMPDEIIEPIEITRKRQELSSLKGLPNPDRVADAIEQLESEIAQARLELQRSANQYSSNLEMLQQVFGDPAYWESLEPTEKREIFRQLCKKVSVINGAIAEIILKV